jgi:hypothetical protein
MTVLREPPERGAVMPEWVQWLQALSVPTIAAVGALLAWQQVKIARTKLRHDLFDRRFKVFEAARTFLVTVMRSGKTSVSEFNDYTGGVIDAQFLLSKEVHTYLFEIRKRAAAMQALNDTLEPLPPGAEKAKLAEKAGEHFAWLVEQLDVLPDKFKPFLTLGP